MNHGLEQFTAASILLLQERGKLSVDDLVKKHLPNAPAAWDTMTIFHLLTHTAGFAGLQTPPNLRGAPIESADGTVEGFVTRLMERPLESKPGEAFNYTNSGYFVLGHLIQKVSGQRYEQFVQEHIFTPLGMKDTGLDSPPVVETQAVTPTTRNANRRFFIASVYELPRGAAPHPSPLPTAPSCCINVN